MKRVRVATSEVAPTLVDGEPFTGIGYVPDGDEWSYKCVHFVDGVPGTPSEDPVLPLAKLVNARHPKYRLPENVSGATFFDEVFDGLEIRIGSDDFVWQARLIEDGRVAEWYKFDRSGVVVQHIVNVRNPGGVQGQGFGQQMLGWSASGVNTATNTTLTVDGRQTSGGFSVDKEGRLSAVRFGSGYFEALTQRDEHLPYPSVRDFTFLADFATAALEFDLELGDRSDEFVDQLLAHGTLETVSIMRIAIDSAQAQPALDRLADVDLPKLRGVFVEPVQDVSYPDLIASLCNWKRRRGVTPWIMNIALRKVADLAEWEPRRENACGFYFDDDLVDLIGVENWRFRPEELFQFVVDAPSLRFVRYQREDEGRDLKKLFEQRPDITVYGPDVSSEDWLLMVRKQLLDEGVVRGPE